jgi:hypothetical protein
MHVERTGSFVLPLPHDDAFPLFSAEGERRWVPGWDPYYLHPATPSNEAGTVFRTTHGNEETIWLVLRYEPGSGLAEYARLTPGSRVGTVLVRCEALSGTETRVVVTYALTALAEPGNAVLGRLTTEAYGQMLDEWRHLILGSLQSAPERSTVT